MRFSGYKPRQVDDVTSHGDEVVLQVVNMTWTASSCSKRETSASFRTRHNEAWGAAQVPTAFRVHCDCFAQIEQGWTP